MKKIRIAFLSLVLMSQFPALSIGSLLAEEPSFKMNWWKEPPSAVQPPPPEVPLIQNKKLIQNTRKKRETLFERYENHDPRCPEGKKDLCGKYVLNVKLNKTMTKPLTSDPTPDPYASKQSVCVGLCQKQAGVSWSLKWK